MIGDHWFDRDTIPAESINPLVEQNRSMFIEYAADTKQRIMNTMFPTQDKYLCTYKRRNNT